MSIFPAKAVLFIVQKYGHGLLPVTVNCRKSLFFQKSACSQSLSPLGHSDGFASCKAWCVLISASLPKTPFPRKGAILLGLPPLDQARMLAVSHTKPLHDAVAQMADDLYGGYAPNPIFKKIYRFFDRLRSRTVARDRNLFISSHCKSAFRRHSLPSAYCRVLHHRLSAFLR